MSADDGRTGALQLFANPDDCPTGLFCVSDLVALGAMHELRRVGLDVPGDIAVAGYGDEPFSSDLLVPLTSVRQPMHEVGWKAADLMITERFGCIQFRPELIVRASSDPNHLA